MGLPTIKEHQRNTNFKTWGSTLTDTTRVAAFWGQLESQIDESSAPEVTKFSYLK